ncbi:hypothetical protein BR93DRAFT_953239 [Coniochaeta sp. PMI_546]|nr:hypothetical protein BR93DRAFT_953239 [Coniochaeta sp. PMI_546]
MATMIWLIGFALYLLWQVDLAQAKAKAVFAHFMVGNTKSFTIDDWVQQMNLAKNTGIDAFALNMANKDSTNDIALPLAFSAATQTNFKLFFSFDYAGNGPWDITDVKTTIQNYQSNPAYFNRGSKPFVSTFEGPKLASGWDAWPHGDQNMTTFPDASYYDFLGGKPYVMPMSPWFYTNLPGYNKNWLWRDTRQLEAFDIGKAPFNYVQDMPHDGWRDFLPYLISLYKTGTGSFNQKGVTTWYRRNPNGSCGDGGTTGNTASQLQYEYSPNVMMKDRIFYTALLGSNAQVKVSIGGVTQTGIWEQQPFGGIGLYHGSVPINGTTGTVVVSIVRGSTTIATVNGASITTSCTSGLNNYNAWVGSNKAPAAALNCTEGFGVYDFAGLCDFSCHNGYCPSTACSMIYEGLSSFDCNHGYCPTGACGTTPNDGTIPTYSPFLPPACTGGSVLPTVTAAFTGLCDFSYTFGFCPMHVCSCTSTSVLVESYQPDIDFYQV